MIWWIVVIILALIVMRRFWAAFNHPTNMLGKQAAYMNWVAGGFYNDKDGYKNVLFKRGNYEAFISYKKCKVFLVKPANYEPFDDFLAVERWLAEVEVDRPSAHQFGYHISELAIALETHQLYAMDNKIYFAEKSNGRDIYWNCCVSLYASILYAKEKSGVQMELMTWNSFAHSIVVGMVDRQNPSSIMGTPQYQAVEKEAYDDFKRVSVAVREALKKSGAYEIEPIVKHLARLFGSYGNIEAEMALSALILINAKSAHEKIIPEFLASF